MNSLYVKLFSAFLIVIIVAVGVNALYVTQDTEQEIVVYEERTEQLYMLRMEHWLLGYHTHGSGWDDVSVYLEEMEVLSGQRVILTDHENIVIADSQREMVGEYFDSDVWPSRQLFQHRGGDSLGMLYISPEPTIETELTRNLAENLNYSLFVGSFIAVAIALLLTIVLSQAIAYPIKELAEAALKVGKGDFSFKVRIADKGEFGKLAKAFNRMSCDLAFASMQRKHLAADIAHELRSPLTNIRGYIEAIKDNLVDLDAGIDMVDEESAQLVRLVNDLQDIALAEAGVLTLHAVKLNAVAVTRRLVSHYEARANNKGVVLQVELNNQEIEIFTDEVRLNQMLQNLLSNALNNTFEGDSINVKVVKAGNSVLFSVADTGKGIEPEELSHIFDRFYRADPSRARTTGGAGLGLTITKYLAEAQGGSIEAESKPGEGSRFTIFLPSVVRL